MLPQSRHLVNPCHTPCGHFWVSATGEPLLLVGDDFTHTDHPAT